MSGRRAPRWSEAFLANLLRTGEVRRAARDAGVDHTTAYARRKAHPDFGEAWDAALAAHRKVKAEAERLAEEGPSTIQSSLDGPPPHPCFRTDREELSTAASLAAAQTRRAGAGRWSEAKERRFFTELAATANIRRAAEAAGVSTQAVYARRVKRPDFRARWNQALENGRAAIEMKLVAEANRSLDPETMELPEAEPKVSVAEAIRIVKLHGNSKQRAGTDDPFAEEADAMSDDEVAEIRERLLRKLRAVARRDQPDMIAEGWTLDEERDVMVPPGWTRSG